MPQPRRKPAARRRVVVAQVVERPERLPSRIVVRIQTLQRVEPRRPIHELLLRRIARVVPIIPPPSHAAHMTRPAGKRHAAKRTHRIRRAGNPRLVVAIETVVQIQRPMMRNTQLRPEIARTNRRRTQRQIRRHHRRVRRAKIRAIISIPSERDSRARRDDKIRAPSPRR